MDLLSTREEGVEIYGVLVLITSKNFILGPISLLKCIWLNSISFTHKGGIQFFFTNGHRQNFIKKIFRCEKLPLLKTTLN